MWNVSTTSRNLSAASLHQPPGSQGAITLPGHFKHLSRLVVGGATLQTNGPNSAVSESILKPCGAKLDLTKPFFRMSSRKQRSRHFRPIVRVGTQLCAPVVTPEAETQPEYIQLTTCERLAAKVSLTEHSGIQALDHSGRVFFLSFSNIF